MRTPAGNPNPYRRAREPRETFIPRLTDDLSVEQQCAGRGAVLRGEQSTVGGMGGSPS